MEIYIPVAELSIFGKLVPLLFAFTKRCGDIVKETERAKLGCRDIESVL
jgi:hypothetical protein